MLKNATETIYVRAYAPESNSRVLSLEEKKKEINEYAEKNHIEVIPQHEQDGDYDVRQTN